MRTRKTPALLVGAATLTLARIATGQTPPPDPIPSPIDFGLRFCGAMRQVETKLDAQGDVLIWTAGDGGRIRHTSDSNQTWTFQSTPEDANQTLLDIWFEDTQVGWACGRGGRLLHTTDGGANWDHFDPTVPALEDSAGETGTFWGVRTVDDDVGFVVGLDTFKRWDQTMGAGALGMQDVQLFADYPPVTPMDPAFIEFYAIQIIHDPGSSRWVGFAAGDLWGHSENFPGLGFYTDSADSHSNGGKTWWVTFDAVEFAPDGDVMIDPWDLEFESELGDPDTMRGYLVGGTGNQAGFLFHTTDGGLTWTREFPVLVPPDVHLPTLYGVAAMPDGEALAVGYAGTVYWRDPALGQWFERDIPGIATPLWAAESGTGERVWVGSGFGILRGTVDAGVNWSEYLSPYHSAANPEVDWRPDDIHFFDESEGFLVGQYQQISRTLDGGLTWAIVHGGYNPSLPSASQLAAALVSVAFKDTSVGVVASENQSSGATAVPLFHHTSDGGLTWSPSSVTTTDDTAISAVEYAGWQYFWAAGRRGTQGVVFVSVDDGQTWNEVAAPAVKRLNALAFTSQLEGIVVGRSLAGKAAAFRLDPATLQWVDVSPSTGGELLAIEERGGPMLSTAEVYAVGRNGRVYRYDANTDRFLLVAAASNLLDVNLCSIGMAPGGSTILIGSVGPGHERGQVDWKNEVVDQGWAIHFDGGAWSKVRCPTNHKVRSMRLLDDDTGYVLGRTDGGDVSPEVGQINDFVLLRYKL